LGSVFVFSPPKRFLSLIVGHIYEQGALSCANGAPSGEYEHSLGLLNSFDIAQMSLTSPIGSYGAVVIRKTG
jgi:hypothetical protein